MLRRAPLVVEAPRHVARWSWTWPLVCSTFLGLLAIWGLLATCCFWTAQREKKQFAQHTQQLQADQAVLLAQALGLDHRAVWPAVDSPRTTRLAVWNISPEPNAIDQFDWVIWSRTGEAVRQSQSSFAVWTAESTALATELTAPEILTTTMSGAPTTWLTAVVRDTAQPVFLEVRFPNRVEASPLFASAGIPTVVGGLLAAVGLISTVGFASWGLVTRLFELRRWIVGASRGELAPWPMTTNRWDMFSIFKASVARLCHRIRRQVTRLERAKNDLRTMLETIPEGVVAIDAHYEIIFANPGIYRMLGVAHRPAHRRKLWEVFRNPTFQNAVADALKSPEPISRELVNFESDRVLAFRGRSLMVESGRGLIVVLHDITELRRLERLRQEFVANVSHELKTPLAAIKAYTETLLTQEIDEPEILQRFLRRIDEQSDRLHLLVQDMLLLAKAESHEHAFDIGPMPLIPVVAEVVREFREAAQAHAISLELRHPDDMEPWVQADQEGLATIIRNLVDNAIKYTGTGGKICVSLERDGEQVLLHVADTGVGIPREDLHLIFDRFYRVDKSRSRAVPGTGLGLSIVKRLTQLFSGTVSVKSRLHTGSIFTVALPALCRDDAAT